MVFKIIYSVGTISPIRTPSLVLVHLFGVSLIMSLKVHLTATKEFGNKIDSAKYSGALKWLHETEINKVVRRNSNLTDRKVIYKASTNHPFDSLVGEIFQSSDKNLRVLYNELLVK